MNDGTRTVTGNLLHNGAASLFYQRLVQEKKIASETMGGVNWPLGNPYDYGGPVLMTSFILYPTANKEKDVLEEYDRVINDLSKKPVGEATLNRVLTKMTSDWFSELESPVWRASTLSILTLLEGSPERINTIPEEVAKVRPQEIQAFAKKYLVPTNRTIINCIPDKQVPPKEAK